ncbi:MAG: FmdB family transcriptional regulator [Opitutus sp.]
MPIYEYYCPNNHTIYQFYAKTLAQGKRVPKCPDDPSFEMRKLLSSFAVTSAGKMSEAPPANSASGEGSPDDTRMEAAMNAMESEFSSVDENDPRAMGRMMRRMSELTGEKLDGEMEEVVRKLEEGADPESLDEELGGEAPCSMPDPNDPYGAPAGDAPRADPKEPKHRFKARKSAPSRDPKLYDYD